MMINETQFFNFTNICAPSAVTQTEIKYFADQIPSKDKILDEQHEEVCASSTLDDLSDGSLRKPKNSSPGIDRLPYKIYNLLFAHDRTAKLAIDLFNDALEKGIFPESWQGKCVVLLPKNQNLASLMFIYTE